MEVVIDYEALKSSHNETLFKELALVADGVIRIRHFQAPYDMQPHGSAEYGLNWDMVTSCIISYRRPSPKLWQETHIFIHTPSINIYCFKN
jgi:hypothetical protein